MDPERMSYFHRDCPDCGVRQSLTLDRVRGIYAVTLPGLCKTKDVCETRALKSAGLAPATNGYRHG
jgi:hypothetical protein